MTDGGWALSTCLLVIGGSSRTRCLLRSFASFVIIAEKQCWREHLSHAPDPSKKAFDSSPCTMIIYSFGDILRQPAKPLFIPVWWTLFIMNWSWACQVLVLCVLIWPYCFSFLACWCGKIILSAFYCQFGPSHLGCPTLLWSIIFHTLLALFASLLLKILHLCPQNSGLLFTWC